MDLITPLTTVLAVYGAVLSTVLGILELRKERRQISIILQFAQFANAYSVIITNIGHRPITITGMFVMVGGGNPVRRNLLRSEKGQPPFPITLTDGQHTSIDLPITGPDLIEAEHKELSITVYDAEGKEYTKYR